MFRALFIDPKTGHVYKEGQTYKMSKLADTLEIISHQGAAALYDGELTAKLVEDIRSNGGIITTDDMRDYR